jgi:hypothetical protein
MFINFNVPLNIRKERFDTCRACKYYKASTHSCGTKFFGDKIEDAPEENTITYYRRKERLCGCDMRLKTWLRLGECPLGKWGKYKLTDGDVERLNTFLDSLPKTGSISDPTIIAEITSWFNKMSDQKLSCTACNAMTILSELKRHIKKNNE